MTFLVGFKASCGNAVEILSSYIGIEAVDFIRDEVDCSLSLDKISGCCNSTVSNPQIYLTEGLARESNVFTNTCRLEVFVGVGFLNQFCDKKLVTRQIRKQRRF